MKPGDMIVSTKWLNGIYDQTGSRKLGEAEPWSIGTIVCITHSAATSRWGYGSIALTIWSNGIVGWVYLCNFEPLQDRERSMA